MLQMVYISSKHSSFENMYHGFHKVLSRTTGFIIDNNKKHMNKWFLKDHVRLNDPKDWMILKTEAIAAENSALPL